jgi:hypothetical protein
MPDTLLAATTGASASSEFVVRDSGGGLSTMPAVFTCPGIAGAETGTLQKKAADGNWSDYVLPCSGHIISTSLSGVVVSSPGTYRINKTATVAAVPVEVSHSGNP